MQREPHITIDSTAQAIEEHYSEVQPMDPNKPRVLFPSDLVLTREQEDKLCQKAQEWYSLLDDELGRTETASDGMEVPLFIANYSAGGGGAGQQKPERKFLAKRLLYQMIAENRMEFRAILAPNSIFAKSNLIVPLARKIATAMGARAVDYFFGTEPWLEQKPIGGDGDAELAMKLQKLTDVKFQESGSTARLRRSLPAAFIIGESVMKITQANRREFYRKKEVVAVGMDGNPILAADGQPITEQDTWTMQEDGQVLLDRDGQTPKPAGELVYQPVLMDAEIVHYSGPEVNQIYYRDFLCPKSAPSIQEAPCCIHMMESTASEIAQAYMQSPGKTLEDVQRAVEGLRDALSGAYEHRGGDQGARPELGDTQAGRTAEATTEYGEFYMRIDADGDFLTEDVMLVMNPKTGYPIYYNYTANVTSDGLRPFRAIVPKPVLNRWYGQGAIEQFEEHQETVDLMVNRRNLSQSAAGRITLFRGYNTLEGDSDPNLKMNWGQTYTPLANKRAEDIVEVVYLDDNKYDTLTQDLEFFMQLALNESGIQHANDGNAAGMDTTKLATGIRNIEKSGRELFGVVISELEKGITETAQAFTTTLYDNLDEDETFEFLEGDLPVEMTIAKRDVQGLRMNVQTLLTRYRDEQALASNGQAYALLFGAIPYYSLPPEMQQLASSFVRSQLKALQIQRADEYVIPQAMPMGGVAPGAPPSGVPKQEKKGTPNL
jgi:hypothetical protein